MEETNVYINLSNELKYLGIKNKELAQCFSKKKSREQWLSKRLCQNIKFKNDEMDLIFKFLKEKGCDKTKEELFLYSDRIQNANNRTPYVIDSLMKRMNITNIDLGAMIGVSSQTISAWRNDGNIKISEANLEKLAKALNCSVSVLKGFDNDLDKSFKGVDYERVDTLEQSYMHNIKDLVKELVELRGYEINVKSPSFDTFVICLIDDFIDEVCNSKLYKVNDEKRNKYLNMKNYDYQKGLEFYKKLEIFKQIKYKGEKMYVIDDIKQIK